MRAALALYGLLHAVAYSSLLPLWEGFDEAYHYGYVQSLSTRGRFPVLDRAFLSREIWHSLELAPVSHYLQPFTGAPMNFTDYFALPAEERRRLRRELDAIPAREKYESETDKPNYEVNQSPLPYLFMAPVDRALSNLPISARVLWLRLICSTLAVILLLRGTELLARQLALPAAWFGAAVFCLFSSQMVFATLCHVCNDWLAVPLFSYVVWAAIRVHVRGMRRDCILLGAILAAALLTKAYFLIFVPFAVALVGLGLWRGRVTSRAAMWFAAALLGPAAPWYARNLALYGNLSATVASTSGIGIRELGGAALRLPWLESLAYMAHSSLWTGNNSFTTFSAATLDILLLLLACGLFFCFLRTARDAPERLIAAAIAVFGAGLAYISATFFASSRGGAFAAVPWYAQGLVPPGLLLAFLGFSRAGTTGRILARLTLLVYGYLFAATFFAKLVPLYGGAMQSRARLADLFTWYRTAWPGVWGVLGDVCPASPAVVAISIGAAVVLELSLTYSVSKK